MRLEHAPLLPEVFRDVLASVHARPRTAEEVREVIRSRIGFKEALISGHWASWDDLTQDVLAALSGYLTEKDGKMHVTARAVPGRQLDVRFPGGRARVTFHASGEKQAREILASARIRAGELASFLSGHQDLHPAIRQAAADTARIAQLLSGALSNPDAPVRADGRSYIGGQSAWYRDWVRTAGWHSTDDARLAWNSSHPGRYLAEASDAGFRTAMRQLTADGQLEVRPSIRKDGKGGGRQYRWTGE